MNADDPVIGTMTVIHPDHRVVKTPLKETPEVRALQEAVEGFIETVPFFETFEGKPCVAFCNEEGKLRGMQFNIKANVYWRMACGGNLPNDHLVGPIVVLTGTPEFLEAL